MSRILDRVAVSSAQFSPHNIEEFFALQLARKLNDAAHLQDYVRIGTNVPQQVAVIAFHRAMQKSGQPDAAQFHLELARIQDQELRA